MRQIKSLLSEATWPDAPNEVVFGQVLVSAGPSPAGLGQLRFPFALILPLDATTDDEEELLEVQRFEVRVVARVANDPWGETVLLGGARTAGQGSSGGRGLLELEEVINDTVAAVNEAGGIRLRLDGRSAVEANIDEELGYVGTRAFRIEAWTTADRSYAAPTRLTATDQGGGSVLLAWSLPPDRYDRFALILRRDAGATPPASPAAGTGVAVGALVTSVTDSPGAGTFSYALFMGYDELTDPPATADRFSAGATVTVVVT